MQQKQFISNFNQLNMFREIITPILRNTRRCLQLVVVVVVIWFSIILSCTFISLLLVTVGIVYSKMGSNINVIISILFYGENNSFEASLVMYINSTNTLTTIITNRIYENQNLLYIVPLIRHTLIVIWYGKKMPAGYKVTSRHLLRCIIPQALNTG
jgi:hypothetical protein